MNASSLGFLSALGCYTIWGSLPLYFRYLGHVGPEELLVHRIIWAVPTGLVFLAMASQWRALRLAVQPGALRWLALSAALIGLNWYVYIWAVGAGRVLEASLGYYINPLLNVLLGMLIFSERLRRGQWTAVALAGLGVGVLTVAFGRLPWIALVLATTFAFYSVIRKRVQVDGRAGFVVEAGLLFPLAAAGLALFATQAPEGRWLGDGSLHDAFWLLAAGPITAVPLILFALAAKRLSLTTIGMMQYIGPTLQFVIAVFVFKEPFGSDRQIGLALIWAALFVFTADSLAHRRPGPTADRQPEPEPEPELEPGAPAAPMR